MDDDSKLEQLFYAKTGPWRLRVNERGAVLEYYELDAVRLIGSSRASVESLRSELRALARLLNETEKQLRERYGEKDESLMERASTAVTASAQKDDEQAKGTTKC